MKIVFSNGRGMVHVPVGTWVITAMPFALDGDGLFYDDFAGHYVKHAGGGQTSLSEDEKATVAAYLATAVQPAPTPPTPDEIATAAALAKDIADIAAAKVHAKLNALKTMSPAQIDAWVRANVTNLAQAQDAIATLAVAVGVLARRL